MRERIDSNDDGVPVGPALTWEAFWRFQEQQRGLAHLRTRGPCAHPECGFTVTGCECGGDLTVTLGRGRPVLTVYCYDCGSWYGSFALERGEPAEATA